MLCWIFTLIAARMLSHWLHSQRAIRVTRASEVVCRWCPILDLLHYLSLANGTQWIYAWNAYFLSSVKVSSFSSFLLTVFYVSFLHRNELKVDAGTNLMFIKVCDIICIASLKFVQKYSLMAPHRRDSTKLFYFLNLLNHSRLCWILCRHLLASCFRSTLSEVAVDAKKSVTTLSTSGDGKADSSWHYWKLLN